MLSVNNKSLCESCFCSCSVYPCPGCGFGGVVDASKAFALPLGTILMGKYAVGKILGKGGFGITYLGCELATGKRVAIKEYFPDGMVYRDPATGVIALFDDSTDELFREGAGKFYYEAETLAKFKGQHNIVGVYEFFYQNNTAYFVMEYVNGVDLKTFVKSRSGRIGQNDIFGLMTELIKTLIILHGAGVLHRDISPDNIYITKDGSVKLLDFGAARQVFGERSKSLSVVLKQGFAPIEQYQKHGSQGPWTDIYALGATVYYCIFGTVPDDATSRIDNDSVLRVLEADPTISVQFKNILMKMLAVHYEYRYKSVIELQTDFVAMLKTNADSVQKNGQRQEQENKINVPTKEQHIDEQRKEPVISPDAHQIINQQINLSKQSDGKGYKIAAIILLCIAFVISIVYFFIGIFPNFVSIEIPYIQLLLSLADKYTVCL